MGRNATVAPLDAPTMNVLAARVVSTTGTTHTAIAPFTTDPLAEVPLSSTGDVTTAFEHARLAQREWASWPVRRRAEVLDGYHDLVLDHQHELLDLIQAETGKARVHAFEEIADIAVTARYYARNGPAMLAATRRAGALPLLTRTTQLHHPKGVVGVISPWNYPLSLAIGDGLAAVLAGNGVVLKPDLRTPLVASAAIGLLERAGLPAGLWQLVHGDGPVIGGAVLDQADYVCFTGSTATGRTVAEQAGRRLVGCSLELGGKNSMLVLADADVAAAAECAVRACFSSAGQLCISIERLYVAEPIRERFIGAFLERVRALTMAARYDYGADLGSLISDEQLARVRAHVDDAVDKGATVLAGGKPRPDVGPLFFEPTVLAEVTPDMALYAAETFGPVVAVYSFTDPDDAIALANDTSYGLNASVWTRDTARGVAIAARLRAGTVNVNEGYAAAWGSVDAPMGGMRDSGLGRRHGAEGLLRFTEPQTVAVQRWRGLGTPRGLSHRAWAATLTRALRVLKRLGVR